MAKQSRRQREIVGRVMHEFKHGELETRGRKVRNPRQAIAIGLSEAGASNRQSPATNRKRRAKTEEKERKGQTARQRKEGRGTGGPASRKSGAKKARSAAPKRTTRRAAAKKATSKYAARAMKTPRQSTRSRRARRGEPTRAQLYAETRRRGMHGTSRMSKAELEQVLQE